MFSKCGHARACKYDPKMLKVRINVHNALNAFQSCPDKSLSELQNSCYHGQHVSECLTNAITASYSKLDRKSIWQIGGTTTSIPLHLRCSTFPLPILHRPLVPVAERVEQRSETALLSQPFQEQSKTPMTLFSSQPGWRLAASP